MPDHAGDMGKFSAALFGNRHRLAVAIAIRAVSRQEPHNLYKQALADALGLTDSEIEKHFRDFKNIGLLEKDPEPPSPPKKRGRGKPPTVFRITDDKFWHCLDELGQRFRRPPPSARAQKSP